VSIGIGILLGGVWVVSIQPGGGGVDLGTWDEEIVELNAEDLVSILEYNETDEVIPSTQTVPLLKQPSIIPQQSMPMDRETRSESSMPSISGIDNQRPRRANTLYDSPRLPSIHTAGHSMISPDLQHARISTSPAESPILNRLLSHTRAPMHQPSSFHLPHPHAHPLTHGTLSSTLGPAFQIGLSPVSPGFAILPMERKKTNTYAAGGDGVNGNSGPGRRRYWTHRIQRRRTVSDGEVSRVGHGSLGRPAESMADPGGEVEASREGWVGGSEVETGSSLRHENQEVGSTAQQTGLRWLTNFLPRWSHKD
jgi:hypothetical protein